ncbi:MAG: hypothetical protein IPN68_15810 [Bacteroidetes bacterium]|nr:hypothetical protein [Bacteroidota bacterium]
MGKNWKSVVILSILLLVISCNKENNLYSDGLTLSDFENHLVQNMTYESIVLKFGTPAADTGSGIHIYVYNLIDSTEVWIGYSDKILYVRQMDSNHFLLKTLL